MSDDQAKWRAVQEVIRDVERARVQPAEGVVEAFEHLMRHAMTGTGGFVVVTMALAIDEGGAVSPQTGVVVSPKARGVGLERLERVLTHTLRVSLARWAMDGGISDGE